MPGGVVCSVAVCKNNSKKIKDSGQKLMFFSFPKDPLVRKEWIKKCRRSDEFSIENKRVCSEHFMNTDYEDNMQARLMGSFPKKLKKSAIPSLHLLHPALENVARKISKKCREEKMKERERKMSKKSQEEKRKEVVEKLISSHSYSQLDKPHTIISAEKVNLHTDVKNEADVFHDISVSHKIMVENNLKQELQKLQEENELLKTKIQTMEAKDTILNQKLSQVEKQLEDEGLDFEEKVKMVFKDFLTPNQVDIALKKKTKARWTQEELLRAFTLRYFSKRSYIYLKNNLKYPLPGTSTLQQWAANINLQNCVLEDVLE